MRVLTMAAQIDRKTMYIDVLSRLCCWPSEVAIPTELLWRPDT